MGVCAGTAQRTPETATGIGVGFVMAGVGAATGTGVFVVAGVDAPGNDVAVFGGASYFCTCRM